MTDMCSTQLSLMLEALCNMLADQFTKMDSTQQLKWKDVSKEHQALSQPEFQLQQAPQLLQ